MGNTAPRVAWVTGAAGFIGPHVMARLQEDGWRVIGLDRAPALAALDKVVSPISAAALDEAARLAGVPSLVFHAAGTGTVGDSTRDPAASQRDTVAGAETVLAWLGAHSPNALFILPSSAAVYGNVGEGPLREDMPLDPISVYGKHKVAAERACEAAAAKGLRVAILRLFSVYGPGLRKQLPWDLGRKLLADPAHLELFGTGAETRDFLAVSDVAEIVAFLARTPFVSPVTLNCGTGVGTRIDRFAADFAAAAGVAPVITFNGQTRAGDPTHLYADVSRLTALGFQPTTPSVAAGLARYVEWMKTLG